EKCNVARLAVLETRRDAREQSVSVPELAAAVPASPLDAIDYHGRGRQRRHRNKRLLAALGYRCRRVEGDNGLDWSHLPALRCRADFGVYATQPSRTWKLKLDEPMLEQPPRHLFENCDPARVVFDQVVVRRKD